MAALALVLAGCGSDDSKALTGAELEQKGRSVFNRMCASCHGDALGGSAMAPSMVTADFAAKDDAAIRTAITKGVPAKTHFGPMPPLLTMKGGDIEAVIAYIRARQVDAGLTPTR